MWRDEPLKPVPSMPAIYIEKPDATVIADVHIGYETELARKGIFLPKTQIDRLIDRLTKLKGVVGSKRLVINGDLKHSFSRLTRQERREIDRFMNHALSLYEEVIVVRGNHDNYLSGFLRKLNIEFVEKGCLGDILLVHGHKALDVGDLGKHRWVVIGHEHPSIVISDRFGYKYRFPAFLYVPTKHMFTILVLPAFTTLSSGNIVTIDREALLSPLLKKYGEIEDAVPIVFGEDLGLAELPPLKVLSKL